MWIFTTEGCFSVSLATTEYQDGYGTQMQVRGRRSEDLERLRTLAKAEGVGVGEVIHTPQADYPYRFLLHKFHWERLAEILASRVDYTNFKDHVKEVRTKKLGVNQFHPEVEPYLHLLHKVWAEGGQYQHDDYPDFDWLDDDDDDDDDDYEDWDENSWVDYDDEDEEEYGEDSW